MLGTLRNFQAQRMGLAAGSASEMPLARCPVAFRFLVVLNMRQLVSRHSRSARRRPRFFMCLASSLLAAAAALGCANDSPRAPTQPPQPPDQVPDSPPVKSFTVSGVVFEHTATGRRPAAEVAVRVLSDDNYGVTTTTDADGRYVASVRDTRVSIAPEESEAYMSPCPSGTNWLVDANRTIDVDIVSKAVLLTTGVPDSYPRTSIYVAGTIVEATADRPRPVTGALVALGYEPVHSTTLTDALGRYVVCTAPPVRLPTSSCYCV
jgi:hypothetical protein